MATAKDPVCGMDVEENKAVKSQHQGKSYYFCSPGCKEQFDRHPDRYIGRKIEQQRKSA